MREERGNIWDYLPSHAVVVSTNIGWKKDGTNPMGRGIAAEAARMFSALPLWYGTYCRAHGILTGVVDWTPDMTAPDGPEIVLFSTKTLDPYQPHISWMQKSSLELIGISARQLAELWQATAPRRPCALPLVGCQNGRLMEEEDVVPILRKWLVSDEFVLVRS